MASKPKQRAAAAAQPAPAKQPPRPAPAWLRPATLALAAVVLLACFSVAFQDNDAWWQLKTGQYIAQQHKLPAPDPFSFTTYLRKASYAGEEITRDFNLKMEWLAQVFLYLAFAAGGFPFVVLVRALLMTGVSGLVGWMAWRRSGHFHLSIAAALLSATISYRFAVDRPQLVTYLMVACAIAILEFRWKLWLLIPLFAIWSNCHAGFFMGWAVLACYVAESLLRRWTGNPDPRERQLWIVSAAAILASGLNPNGFRIIDILLKYRNSYLISRVAEWRPTPLLTPSPFVLLTLAAGIILLLNRRNVRIVDWFLFGGFAIVGAYAYRNIVFMAIVGPLLIAANFPWKALKLPPLAEYGFGVVVAALIVVPLRADRAFQFHASEIVRPAGAAAFLEQHNIRDRMYNNYEHGGYVIWRLWPQQQTFMDGRVLNEAVYRDYRRITYNLQAPGERSPMQLLDDYGVQVILTTGYEFVAGSVHFLVPALADPRQTEWKLVYKDAQAMVFMRRPPEGVQAFNNQEALGAMEQQCTAHIDAVPSEALCARETCKLYEHMGNMERARTWMAYYLSRKVEADPEAEAEYQRLIRGLK